MVGGVYYARGFILRVRLGERVIRCGFAGTGASTNPGLGRRGRYENRYGDCFGGDVTPGRSGLDYKAPVTRIRVGAQHRSAGDGSLLPP